ncbi:MAG: PIN domain nuclease [Candidatus Acidulodesulfobacterium acidiphilum]|uniref:PIN domain nuclease n=1 Tax=Candidatus Acidulodesulfobacterium acidiphilum TaxID=2597224 RepID=A0A520X9S5_9DELT|nr:MAG: PIN domain nuclease [Candidatus Acidulodesulfobacterium acidiphilum]
MKNKPMRVLVDTSVWIEFFKANSSVSNNLELLLIEDSVEICGVVLFELLQGIKSESEKLKIKDILLNLPYVEINKNMWQKSAEISLNIKKKGYTIPFSDILIGTLAIENNFSVFTLDKHFELIPELALYKI